MCTSLYQHPISNVYGIYMCISLFVFVCYWKLKQCQLSLGNKLLVHEGNVAEAQGSLKEILQCYSKIS